MKFQLLPSTFDENGRASSKQHLSCFIIDDCVAIDAGSLAMAADSRQKKQIRDIVLTHAHLDHIAGLPLFIDDLFADVTEPIRVRATAEVINILERDVFNWDVYPKFSELKNDFGAVLEYVPFEAGNEFSVKHLHFKAIGTNHQVPSVGFIVFDSQSTLAFSGDTAEMNEFWEAVNEEDNLDALLIECAFPDELTELAEISHHLTPTILRSEIAKSRHKTCPSYIINIKPMYRDKVITQINALKIENLQILDVGRIYHW